MPVNVLYMLVQLLHAWLQLISGAFELFRVAYYVYRKFMVCTAHRLQCKILHFPKHEYPVLAAWNVQTQLKSMKPVVTLLGIIEDSWPDFKSESTVHWLLLCALL